MTELAIVTVTRSFTMDAAHVLPWHPGKCSRLHGHTYRIDVSVTGPLNQNGIVIDFGEIKSTAAQVISPLDHTLLNDTLDNPTAERLALHILSGFIKNGLGVSAVRVWETADCSAEVKP